MSWGKFWQFFVKNKVYLFNICVYIDISIFFLYMNIRYVMSILSKIEEVM